MKSFPTLLWLLWTTTSIVSTANAFVSTPAGGDMTMIRRRGPKIPIICKAQQQGDDDESLQSNLQMRWRIFQESQSAGYDFKQTLALVIAGEYDVQSTQTELQSLIDSAGCVMFSWKNSPSCKSAVTALTDVVGADFKTVPLDEPWDKGNELRAELSKQFGRSSLPAIFIGGKYVGGYDGGVSDEAPGIVNLSFQGKLLPMLEAAGAVKSSEAAAVVSI
jgi:glutaredoxin